jgi:acetate kinase
MFILVINSGSSSIKYRLYDVASGSAVTHGVAARIGEAGSYLEIHGTDSGRHRTQQVIATHARALELILAALVRPAPGAPLASLAEIGAVGHRAVHGGDAFVESVRITDDVIAEMERCVPLAPLHNPPNLMGMREARRLLPGVPQVAVFDTAFHQSMPPEACTYALPGRWRREHHLRRYGFHGTSYRYVCGRVGAMLARPLSELQMVVCHLGNGCSMVAVSHGRAVDTSMGFTPMEGLVMGTRSGDVDPGIVLHLTRGLGMTAAEADHLLNQESGLLGLSEVSNDMRVITERAEAGDERCRLALDVFTYRTRKYVGAYAAAMGGIDTLVFTGGIGENSATVRRMVCTRLAFLGIALDDTANQRACGVEADISGPMADVRVLVVPTDEEWMIAMDTIALGIRSAAAAGDP